VFTCPAGLPHMRDPTSCHQQGSSTYLLTHEPTYEDEGWLGGEGVRTTTSLVERSGKAAVKSLTNASLGVCDAERLSPTTAYAGTLTAPFGHSLSDPHREHTHARSDIETAFRRRTPPLREV